VSIGTKNLETTLDELKRTLSQSADDKTKAAVKNKFCSASGGERAHRDRGAITESHNESSFLYQ